MRLRTKFVITTLAIGIVAFMLNPAAPLGEALWGGMPEEGPQPNGVQVAFLMVYTAIASLAMGFGIAFWAFGLPWTRTMFPVLTVPAHLAIGFISGSFWIHDSLHMVNGHNVNGLIALEFGFHAPMIASGVILAVATLRGVQVRASKPGYAATA